MRVGGQRHAPAVLPPGNDPVPIVQKAGWAPGPFWTGADLAPHRDSIPGVTVPSTLSRKFNSIHYKKATLSAFAETRVG